MDELLKDIDKKLTDLQIRKLAEIHKIPYAALMAVLKVESLGSGFYKDTLIPIVRFENHVFSRFTKGIYDKKYPNLSSAKFTNQYNLKGINEFKRFTLAYNLDKDAAIQATSWGISQVMGMHYKLIADTPLEFMKAMFVNETNQVTVMLAFIESKGLVDDLQTQNWRNFSYNYNGKDYERNNYHIKLAAYYNEYNK